MKIRTIVYITTDEPETPRFDDGWDQTAAATNPEGVNASLAETLMNPNVCRATVVDIEVPDADLLQQINRFGPAIPGRVVGG